LRIRLFIASLASLAAIGAGASPAMAAESTVWVKGYDEPSTPSRYDRVRVMRFGPAGARRVLVLVPGSNAGAGNFTLVARELVRRVPRLAVWAVDRRPNRLEDTSRFRGSTSADEALEYYGGLRFRQVDGARQTPYARRWGLKVSLEDLRRVVLAARRGGRKVTLGGHSLGASTAAAYGAWDFAGRPGYRDIDGLVLIDGGLLGTFDSAGLIEARQRKGQIDRGEPFDTLLPELPAWSAGVLAELGAMYARRDPKGRSTLQRHPLFPAAFNPPVPVTNEGLLGFAFDRDTSPRNFQGLWVRAGFLTGSGDPQGWIDGGRTPVQNIARLLFQEPVNSVEWYFPRRLTLDVDAADSLRQTRAAMLLGLRLRHLARMDEPIYAYQSAFAGGRVVRGARRLFQRSDSPRAVYANDPGAMHNDALWGRPSANFFVRTVVPFLRRLS
jgi:hypothetical protein